MSKVDQKLRIAFAGFRHGHIMDVHSGALAMGLEIAGCCEENANARQILEQGGKVRITHSDIRVMLDSVDCDVVAVGDYYGKRGSIIIEALSRGKHVISDKPVCTDLDELDVIEKLISEKGLSLGCQLDMRDKGQFIKLRELILQGVIGEVKAVNFGGQHPLLPESRSRWYFEEGKHGGTINDIAIHAFDLIPWMTGVQIESIVAARSWNALAHEFPHMLDAAQFMLRLSNGCGVLGDVSYLMPGSMGYGLPQYWRMTVWGAEGVLETSATSEALDVMTTRDQVRQKVDALPRHTYGYLKALVHEIQGHSIPGMLTTAEVLRASRWALLTQKISESENP